MVTSNKTNLAFNELFFSRQEGHSLHSALSQVSGHFLLKLYITSEAELILGTVKSDDESKAMRGEACSWRLHPLLEETTSLLSEHRCLGLLLFLRENIYI